MKNIKQIQAMIRQISKKTKIEKEDLRKLHRLIVSNTLETITVNDDKKLGLFKIVLSDVDHQIIDFLSRARLDLTNQSYAQHIADLFFSAKSIGLGLKRSQMLSIHDRFFRPVPTAANILVEWTGQKYKLMASGHNYWIQDRLFHAEESTLAKIEKVREIKGILIAYPSLEPCSSRLKTKSCCQLLAEAKIKKVVFPSWDSNPNQMFRSIQKLRKTNVEVVFLKELELLAAKQNRHLPISTFLKMIATNSSSKRQIMKRIIADVRYYWFGQKPPASHSPKIKSRMPAEKKQLDWKNQKIS